MTKASKKTGRACGRKVAVGQSRLKDGLKKKSITRSVLERGCVLPVMIKIQPMRSIVAVCSEVETVTTRNTAHQEAK